MRTVLYIGGAVAILLSYGVLFVLGPSATDLWVQEDRIVETVGAVGLLAASVFFCLILIKGRRDGRFGTVKKVALVGLVILFFVLAGEEISWGQRYLGVATPPAIKDMNAQGEINIHNLKEFKGWLDTEHMFQLFWVVFGVVFPVAAAVSKRIRVTLDHLMPVLPLWVAVGLILNQIVAWGASAFNHAYPSLYEGRYYTFSGGRMEVTEFVVEVIFGLGAYVVYRQMKSADSGETTRAPSQRESGSLTAGP